MNKLASVLGFASKAGQIVAGTAAVENAVRKHQLQLVICTTDLAARTLKNFNNLCQENQIDFYCIGSRPEIGRWIGKPGRGVIGIASKQFAEIIRPLLNDGGDLP